MRIEVLGPVRLSTEAGAHVEVAERHLRLLLASFAAAGEPVPADVLVDRLWHEELPAEPRKVLRAKLSRLRTALDRAEPGARALLRHTPAGYLLDLPSGSVDTDRFRESLERARRTEDAHERIRLLREVLAMWRGQPFGDIGDALWLAPVLAELRDLRGEAVELLARTLVEQGEPEGALSLIGAVIHEHPARERLVAAKMLALYRLDRQSEALESFEKLRHRLAEDLGADPGPHLSELHAQILRHDPALSARTEPKAVSGPEAEPGPAPEPEPPPERAPVAGARLALPAETVPLIGRRNEAVSLRRLLDAFRLVTLVGTGGVGKTRLAVHVARELAARPGQRIWFADLTEVLEQPQPAGSEAPVRPVSCEDIAAHVIAALDLPKRSLGVSDTDQLAAVLERRPVLLVLDNCEHLTAAAAEFVAGLLRRSGEVRVLATSREPLGLPEEQLCQLDTLGTEPPGPGELSAAAEFFLRRAQAGDPDFRLDAATAPAVQELCRRLDGLPLALELAAARLRGISAAELLERLDDRLRLLARPGGGVPPRQQTLRGTIEWSWSLLDARQRTVLRRLAVHPGSLSLDAAEAVCGDGPDRRDGAVSAGQVARTLLDLVERSMVVSVPTPTGTRYRLLESIAAFAAEKLEEAGERDVAARRHLDFHLRLVREADAHLRGPGQRRWLNRLAAERTQLRHAFDEAVRTADGGSAVALSLAGFWQQWILGCHDALAEELDAAVALPGPRDDRHAAATVLSVCMHALEQPAGLALRIAAGLERCGDGLARARVQWFAGASLLATGAREAGESHVEAALGVLLAEGEDWEAAVAASQRDWFRIALCGEAPHGLPDGRDPEELLLGIGDGWGTVQALSVRHRAAEVAGDHREAAAVARRALGTALEFELWAEASDWHSACAIAAVRAGDLTRAAEHLERARAAARGSAYAHGERAAELAEAMLVRRLGDLDRAAACLDGWLLGAGMEASADPVTRLEQGFLAVERGDRRSAERALGALGTALGPSPSVAMSAAALELAAGVRALRGDGAGAAEALDRAAALRESSGAEPSVAAGWDIARVRTLVDALDLARS
ncbi:AfsR/SARP family transcriptional regulator [Brevibacterium album]|uniref:AfsR/SARP family transcriptional regulator n=1 Tax=Brevibacterium album TaxID=417948 RepID=UPI00042A8948|nr:BTAD domain-containing putative transcriptional regulator [Brevibacterium album]